MSAGSEDEDESESGRSRRGLLAGIGVVGVAFENDAAAHTDDLGSETPISSCQ